jgi:hypothetical protein
MSCYMTRKFENVSTMRFIVKQDTGIEPILKWAQMQYLSMLAHIQIVFKHYFEMPQPRGFMTAHFECMTRKYDTN